MLVLVINYNYKLLNPILIKFTPGTRPLGERVSHRI